jgi:hypothetical protein
MIFLRFCSKKSKSVAVKDMIGLMTKSWVKAIFMPVLFAFTHIWRMCDPWQEKKLRKKNR